MSRLSSALLIACAFFATACSGGAGRSMQPRAAALPIETETSCAGDVCFVYANEP